MDTADGSHNHIISVCVRRGLCPLLVLDWSLYSLTCFVDSPPGRRGINAVLIHNSLLSMSHASPPPPPPDLSLYSIPQHSNVFACFYWFVCLCVSRSVLDKKTRQTAAPTMLVSKRKLWECDCYTICAPITCQPTSPARCCTCIVHHPVLR